MNRNAWLGLILAAVLAAVLVIGPAGNALAAEGPVAQALVALTDPPAEPTPRPTAALAAGTVDITMAELIRKLPDRFFDYAFSLRMVKRGDISYFIRFSALYLDDGKTTRKILDNADFYWMFIDEAGNLWFGIKGSIVITNKQVADNEYLYKYDRGRNRFTLVKKESSRRAFTNRFYQSYFLYVEYGGLKALNTATGKTTYISAVTGDDVFVPKDQSAIYYEDAGGRQIMLTGLGDRMHRRVLKLSDFPLGMFLFEDYTVDLSGSNGVLYRFSGTGYEKVCEFPKLTGWTIDTMKPFYATEEGLAVLSEPGRAATVDFFDYDDGQWRRTGDGKPVEQYGYADDRCWFFTCSSPLMLYVFWDEQYGIFDLTEHIDYCTDVQVDGQSAFIYQYEDRWLTYYYDLDTRQLYRISD